MRQLFFMICAASLSWSALAQESVSTDYPTNDARERAGVAIEPMLIFGRDDATIKTSQLPVIQDDTSATSENFGAGLKLGMHVGQIVTLGADGRYSRNKLSDSAYGNASGDKWTLGPYVGAQMPVAGLRLFGTWVLAGDFDPEAGNQGFNVRFKDPQGYRVGAGFHVGPVSLNLEYESLKFNKTKVQSFGLVNGTANSEVDFESGGWLASVSFPLEL